MNKGTQVTIVGVGLIGGSLGHVFRENDIHVIGCDKSGERLETAVKLGAIDRGECDLERAVAQADVVFICTPVRTIKKLLQQLAGFKLKPGTIVTDTGSTKSELVAFSRQLPWQGVAYIGGHPMAGSHKSGVEAARANLFENAYYLLTPERDTPVEMVRRLTRLCKLTRAKVIQIDAEEHDRIMAAISHWPHVLAALLVHQVGRYNEQSDWYHRLAAGGFRDLTRIASSHPEMWRDITLSNREMVLKQLDDWNELAKQFRRILTEGREDDLEAFFALAKQYRDQLPKRKHGSLPRYYECYVDVPDTPGIIGKVATLLGEQHINLANIGIVENREGIIGALRLSFNEEGDFLRAVEVLKKHGYAVFQFDRENGEKGVPI